MLKRILLLGISLFMLLSAAEPMYYIRRANINYKQVDDMIVNMRVRSRLPEATLPDRETLLYFIRPDSLYTEDGMPLNFPREIFLMDLERLVKDATSMRIIDLEGNKDNVVFIEVIKPVEDREVIFLTMLDTTRWLLSQMKMIDKPEMVADINFIQEEIFPGIYLPTDIRIMIESKATEKKRVPNPRAGIPITSNFGYIDLKFSNYRINTMTGPSHTEPENDDPENIEEEE